MNVVLFLFLYACLGIVFSSGVCSKQVRTSIYAGTIYFTQYFCCNDYEKQPTGCKECPTGSFSAAGSSCVPCAGGTFGKRCADTCECQPDQRCDNVKGCMMSINVPGLSTEFTLKNEANWTLTQTFNTTNGASRQKTHEGMRVRAVVIYVICTATITLMVTVGVYLLINRKKRISMEKIKGKRHGCSNDQYTTIL